MKRRVTPFAVRQEKTHGKDGISAVRRGKKTHGKEGSLPCAACLTHGKVIFADFFCFHV
jgi:hypothetical protein